MKDTKKRMKLSDIAGSRTVTKEDREKATRAFELHEKILERRIVEKILELCVQVRNKRVQPDEIGRFVTKTIAEIGLEKLELSVRDIHQLAMEFSEDHSFLTLNELEDEAKEFLSAH